MSSRETEAAARAMRLAAARAGLLERMHAGVRIAAARARAGQMTPERAIALIAALLEGHAVVQVTPTLERGKSRLAIVASAAAPADVRALLEQAQTPTLDPAEDDMLAAFRSGGVTGKGSSSYLDCIGGGGGGGSSGGMGDVTVEPSTTGRGRGGGEAP